LRKVGRADEKHVDTVEREKLVDVLDRLAVLELDRDERRIVRGFYMLR